MIFVLWIAGVLLGYLLLYVTIRLAVSHALRPRVAAQIANSHAPAPRADWLDEDGR